MSGTTVWRGTCWLYITMNTVPHSILFPLLAAPVPYNEVLEVSPNFENDHEAQKTVTILTISTCTSLVVGFRYMCVGVCMYVCVCRCVYVCVRV